MTRPCRHTDLQEGTIVGARERKVCLGTDLRHGREGHTTVDTDRGRPITQLRPFELDSDTDAVLTRLEIPGVVTKPPRLGLRPFRALVSTGEPAAAALVEERHDRF